MAPMTLSPQAGGAGVPGAGSAPRDGRITLANSPSQTSGQRHAESGRSWVSMSMKVRAIRNQVSTSPPTTGQPSPSFQATAADMRPVSSSTSGIA